MHHDSDWNYVNRADQNRVPNLSRARFDYKRKDEDDMAKSTKTYEERIRALEKKEQESIEATKKLIAQRKELEKRKKAEESKKRTHRLCQIGGAVESVLGCPIEEEDLPKLIGFLKRQETNGKFFSKGFCQFLYSRLLPRWIMQSFFPSSCHLLMNCIMQFLLCC